MQLTLDNLEKCFYEASIRDIKYVGVKIRMKGFPKDEIIINENKNFDSKFAYYKKAYNEDLTLKACNDIRIIGFTYGNSFNDIESDFFADGFPPIWGRLEKPIFLFDVKNDEPKQYDFLEALELMKQGYKMKLPTWSGYWCWDKDRETIMIHCRDGQVLDIRETQVVEYTLTNVCSNEWIIADEVNTPVLGGEALLNFGEALKYIKRGIRMTRKGWNGKGMYVYLNMGGDYDGSTIEPYLVIKNVRGTFNTWVPSIADLTAEDWCFAE